MLKPMVQNGLSRRMGAALALGMLLALLHPGLAPASAAGTRYDFKLEDIVSGQTFQMDQLDQDKPLIVHVWSPECPHCQRHMPYLVALYHKLDLDRVNFVTCSVAESRRSAEDYIRDKHLNFPVLYVAGGKITDSFTSKGWPTTFVFAPGGRLVGTCDTQSSSYVSEMLDLVDKAMNY